MRNDYIIIRIEPWYERCKTTQNISGGESDGQGTQNHRPRKGIPYERIVDKVRSVWIRAQITSQGPEKRTGRQEDC